ncbi:MAG: penicillin-binding protein 2 [Parcubacteria group bacterium]|jgi:penicillin-binding protein 2
MFNNFFQKRRIYPHTKGYRQRHRLGFLGIFGVGVKKGMEIEDSIMTITEEEKATIEAPFAKKGLVIIWYFFIAVVVILGARVFYLDTIKGSYYAQISRENRIRRIPIKAPRGNILDKFGHVLARSTPSIDAIFLPSYLPTDQGEIKKMANELAGILGMEEGNLEILLENQDRKSPDPVLIKENISQDQSLILSERAKELPGVTIDKTAIRSYEDGSAFSHVLGYDGKITQAELQNNNEYLMTDYIGKTGLEKEYEKELRGVYGARQAEIDSLGNVKKDLGIINPEAGSDLVLNIDEELQKKIYDSLTQALENTDTKTAAAVAIDPRNGGILAMVSLPGFDNNQFARGITNDEYKNIVSDKNLPLFNRAVSGEYPPGSTIKPAIATAALTEGTITPGTIIDGLGGNLQIGNFHFGDWKAHGPSDVRTAIAESNDIFFYTVGGGYGNIEGLGMTKMKKYENLFGFGSPTGVDLPSEATGFIPDEDWKLQKIGEKWYIGDSYHCAIGQGFVTATPMQLANYAAALANGGTLYTPRIVNEIKKISGQKEYINPKIIRKGFISDSVLNVVREGMRQTVTGGTAQSLKTLSVPIAGKTGTSQFGTENRTHGWFMSFAPYDNPTIAMIVLVEGGGEGNSSAVPVTKEVYDWYFSSH